MGTNDAILPLASSWTTPSILPSVLLSRIEKLGETSVDGSILSLNSTTKGVLTGTPVAPPSGLVRSTVGAPVSEKFPVVKALVCFLHPTSGVVIPLSGHDWPLVPDGSDAVLRFP